MSEEREYRHAIERELLRARDKNAQLRLQLKASQAGIAVLQKTIERLRLEIALLVDCG